MSSICVSGSKVLVLILLDLMFKVETIYFLNASLVFFLLMRANIREPYRMGLKTLELHALLAEVKLRQLVGCLNIVAWNVSYFVSVLVVIQVLYQMPKFLSGQPMDINHMNIVEPHASVLNVWIMNSVATIVSWF